MCVFSKWPQQTQQPQETVRRAIKCEIHLDLLLSIGFHLTARFKRTGGATLIDFALVLPASNVLGPSSSQPLGWKSNKNCIE